LKGAIENSRMELYQGHQNIDRFQIDMYFSWVSCQLINSDKTLSGSEKMKAWTQIRSAFPPSPPPGASAPTSLPGVGLAVGGTISNSTLDFGNVEGSQTGAILGGSINRSNVTMGNVKGGVVIAPGSIPGNGVPTSPVIPPQAAAPTQQPTPAGNSGACKSAVVKDQGTNNRAFIGDAKGFDCGVDAQGEGGEYHFQKIQK
jgi:hypothetical protein